MFDSCLQKQRKIKDFFTPCTNPEVQYQRIMDLGKRLAPMAEELKTEENRVRGCQSLVYLASTLDAEGRILFSCASSIT